MLKLLNRHRLSIENILYIISHALVIEALINFELNLFLASLAWSYFLMIVGSEIASHRYFCHDSFTTTSAARWGLGLFSNLTMYGSILDWKIAHIIHHRYTDTENDPTSPHHLKWYIVVFGFWRSTNPDSTFATGEARKIAIKSLKDPVFRFYHKYYLVIIFCWVLILAAISPKLVIYGFSIPVLFSFYALNGISYFNHTYGEKHPSSKDHASNLWWVNLFAPGGGWHSNHHRFPEKYRCGFTKWQFDPAAWVIEKFLITEPPVNLSEKENAS